MKKYLFISLLTVVCSLHSQSQSSCYYFQYSYDASGNREHRQYLFNPGCRVAQIDSSKTDIIRQFGVTVFPNPTAGNINVQIDSLLEGEKATLLLYDVQGKLILQKEQAARQEELEIRNISAGVYYLKIYIRKDQVSYQVQKYE
jgi:hypothetical protein